MKRKVRALQCRIKQQLMCICFPVFWMIVAGGCNSYRENAIVMETFAVGSVQDMSADAEGFSTGGQQQQSEETAETVTAMIYVHVAGEVMRPGVYILAAGSRVYEAIEAAGGLTPLAVPEAVNQARVLSDGEQLMIWNAKQLEAGLAETQAASEVLNESAFSIAAGIVNINAATKEQLMQLPGIGEAKAAAILEYRSIHGKFQFIEDIMKVPGIKDGAFQKIKDYITVE